MKKINLPYRTMLEKLADEGLPESGEEIQKKWLGIFGEENFKKIITYKREMMNEKINPALTEKTKFKISMELDNLALTEQAKIKLIAGSFENFYYLKLYLSSTMTCKKSKYPPISTIEEFFELIRHARRVLGEEIVNKIFFDTYRKK